MPTLRQIRLSEFLVALVREAADGMATSISDQAGVEDDLRLTAVLSVEEAAGRVVDASEVELRLDDILAGFSGSDTWRSVFRDVLLRLKDELGLELNINEDFNEAGLTKRGRHRIATEIRRDIARREINRARTLLAEGVPRLRVNSGTVSTRVELSAKQEGGDGAIAVFVRPATGSDYACAGIFGELRLEFSVR